MEDIPQVSSSGRSTSSLSFHSDDSGSVQKINGMFP